MRAPAAVRPSGSASAVRLWVRRDARRRIRSLAVLSVLVAVAGGVVLAVTAGARRNGTVVDRTVALTSPGEVLALPNEPGFDWAAVRRFPEVATLGEFAITVVTVDGVSPDGSDVGFPPASPEMGVDVERPVVARGRALDRSRVDEVVVGTDLPGVHVGDHLTVRMYSNAELESMVTGGPVPANPAGPVQDVTVVGIVKGSLAAFGVQLSQAFVERYRDTVISPNVYVNASVRLRGGVGDIPTFQAHLDALAGHPVELLDQHQARKVETNATGLERSALYAFAAAAAAASLVLVGQAILRTVGASGGDVPLLRALGTTRRELVVGLVAAPLAASLVGVVGALGIAWVLSDRFPIGVGRRLEPTPGRQLDGLVLGLGLPLLIAVLVGGCVLLARRQLRRTLVAPGRHRPSPVARAVARSGAPIPVALGARLALERGRGPSAVPVRPALIGAVVGVLGLVGSLTFRDGLLLGSSDPALVGQHFDAQLGVFGDQAQSATTVQPILDDPDVEMVSEVRNDIVLVDGEPVSMFSLADLEGTYGARPAAGRVPARDDELSLAPTDMRRLGVAVGDVVHVGPEGLPMTVVGETFSPVLSHTPYKEGGQMTDAGLRRFAPDDSALKFHSYLFRFRPGVDVEAAVGRLDPQISAGFLQVRQVVEDQASLRGVRNVPLYLGVFLALLATAAVGHALASAVRRRRHDVAVLRVLGLTRRQARASVAWQATTLAVVGLVVGIPLGIAAGRIIWHRVADTTPMLYVPPAAALAAVLAAPVAIALANALAAWPGRIAARTRPAEVLRVE